MGRMRWIGVSGPGAVLLIAMAWPLRAAPFVPEQPQLPDELLSLAGLDHVQLHLLDLPPSLTRAGLTKARLRAICVERFARDGIEVEDDPQLPGLDLWFKEVRDPGHPRMLCIITVISVAQPVQVPRLDRQMTVPTACFVGGTMTDDEELSEALLRELAMRCGNVARAIKRASKAL